MGYDPNQPNQPNQGEPGQEAPEPRQGAPYGPPADSSGGQPGEPYPQYPPQQAGGPNEPPPGAPYGQPGGQPGASIEGYQGYPPPPPPPGGGPYGAYAQPAPVAPGLQGLFQRWQAVLTRPHVQTFDAQQPGADWSTIWLSLLILGAVEAVSRAIQALENPRFTYEMPGSAPVVIPQNPVGNGISGFIGAFVGFFILSGILFVCAKIFGGQGSFLAHSWLLSLVVVPLEIISAIAGIIPILGGLVAIAAGIFGIFLSIQALASAHRLTTGRAAAAVFLPLIVGLLLACALAIAAAALVAAMLRGIGG